MTTVSAAGEAMDSKRRDASAAMKRVESAGRLLSWAFVVALWMLLALMSMPSEVLKSDDSVMVKRPEPE